MLRAIRGKRMSGHDDNVYECYVCGAPADTHIAGYRIAGVDLMLPRRFVFAYRDRDKRLGLCNQCFGANRFDGFTPVEIAYFREEFAKADADDEAKAEPSDAADRDQA